MDLENNASNSSAAIPQTEKTVDIDANLGVEEKKQVVSPLPLPLFPLNTTFMTPSSVKKGNPRDKY